MKYFTIRRIVTAGVMLTALFFSFSAITHAQTTVDPKDDTVERVTGTVIRFSKI